MATTATTDKSIPFNGNSVAGDPGDQIGPYSAIDRNDAYKYGLGGFDGDQDDRGLYLGILEDFLPEAVVGATQVKVNTGAALVRGVFTLCTNDKTLDVPANGTGSARKDMLVLRRLGAAASSRCELAVLTGDAANYPSLTQDAADNGTFEIPLYRWETPFPFNSLVGVTFECIAKGVNLANGSYAMLLNNSGGELLHGSVVVRDLGAANAITTTTTIGDTDVLGVTEHIEDSEIGKVALTGVVDVIVDGAVSIGQKIRSNVNAGRAIAGKNRYFAYALEAAAGPGPTIIKALLDAPALPSAICRAYRSPALVVAAGGGWTNFGLNSETIDEDDLHNPAVNAHRITIGEVEGMYLIHAEVIPTTGTTTPECQLLLNAAQIQYREGHAAHTAYDVLLMTIMLDLNTGDTIDLQVRHADVGGKQFEGSLSVAFIGAGV